MGSIPQHTIEQIAAANDIVEVIGSYFPLKRAGTTFKALCPFHQEKTPSFTVSPQRQTFHCFGCGVGGTVFRFVMDYEHVDFPTAVRKLGARAGIPVVEERGSTSGDERKQEARQILLRLHAEAGEWFHEQLMANKGGQAARDYLKKRGIDRRIAENWQIGFAPDSWDAFSKWARGQGYESRYLLLSGLVKTKDGTDPSEQPANLESQSYYDRFRGRIMFPIHNDVGEVIAFSGRILGKEAEGAKYLNSPETPLFRKGRVLYGLHKTKRGLIEANCAIVCEGQLDLITVFEAGVPNVVAPQGTAFTEEQARILKRFVSEVILCFDADSAGEKAAERSVEPLLQNNLIIRIAEMPAGEDPDSIIRSKGKEEFENRISRAREFFDYWLEREAAGADLQSLGGKMRLARKMAETVGRIPDPIMRSEVSNKVSARIGVVAGDFEALLKRPSDRDRFTRQEAQPRRPQAAPSHDIAMLCLLALRDNDARAFLLQEEWRQVLSQTPDSEMLVRILESDLHPDDSASLNSFMAGLSPEQEALVSSWLLQKMPPSAAEVARGWWMGIRQALVRRQLQIAEGRLKLPGLTPGETVNLQKQIVDLTEQLRELCKFSSARVLDT